MTNLLILALIIYCLYIAYLIVKTDKKPTLEEQTKRNLTINYWSIK